MDILPCAISRALLIPICFPICHLLGNCMLPKLHVVKQKPIILFYDEKQIMLNMFHIHLNNFLMFPSFGNREFLSHWKPVPWLLKHCLALGPFWPQQSVPLLLKQCFSRKKICSGLFFHCSMYEVLIIQWNYTYILGERGPFSSIICFFSILLSV